MKFTAEWKLIALAVTISIAVGGCSVGPAGPAQALNVPTTPPPGRLAVSVQAEPSVGDVVPVYVSFANGTEDARTVVPNQIFAVNDSGERIAPLPPGEAARQAGNAGELQKAIQIGAIGGVGGAAGSAAGAMAPSGDLTGGLGFNAPSGSTLVGAGYVAQSRVINGAGLGQTIADQQADAEIDALSLKHEDVRHKVVSGYVFFPKGSYEKVEMVLIDRDGGTETIREPWH